GMVVDDADRLHPGIDNRWPDEFEASPLHLLRDRRRQRRLHHPFAAWIFDRSAIRERPAEVGKALAPFGHFAIDARAGDRRSDLRLCSDDTGIGHQSYYVILTEPRHLRRVEARKGFAECLALAQHDDPSETGLEALQHE